MLFCFDHFYFTSFAIFWLPNLVIFALWIRVAFDAPFDSSYKNLLQHSLRAFQNAVLFVCLSIALFVAIACM
jgi:hypothetical protein